MTYAASLQRYSQQRGVSSRRSRAGKRYQDDFYTITKTAMSGMSAEQFTDWFFRRESQAFIPQTEPHLTWMERSRRGMRPCNLATLSTRQALQQATGFIEALNENTP